MSNLGYFNKRSITLKIFEWIRGLLILVLIAGSDSLYAQEQVRQDISLNHNWRSIAGESAKENAGFEQPGFDDTSWEQVRVPHNWDQYEGYRRLNHGNRHGYAWYRKTFRVDAEDENKRYLLWFEGVGSYATVWLNGRQVGTHAGGRTSFTLDVTEAIYTDKENLLAVRADHPAHIRDLPWVCGGCSEEIGFSEGSQPMGIFRPVHLIVTNPVRIAPFGVHIWNDTTVTEKQARVFINTEIRNDDSRARKVTLVSRLVDKEGKTVTISERKEKIPPGTTVTIHQEPPVIQGPALWSPEDPYLYTLVTEVVQKDKVTDRITTPYGIRWIRWDVEEGLFYLNGEQVFINGTAGYEHIMGQSHAFAAEQVKARVMQMKAAGFNAFRDAHQPHNLRYQHSWDSLGMLWWTQMAAHIWFDTPEFRANFKQLLRDWVKERRNSPSIILWGLENESTLPTEFARECTEIIREMDPTTSSQRLVTTCNGGTGTDWNVPQNWTGTYGGDPDTYAEDVQRQVLIGEYGAWRTLDLHTEGPFDQDGIHSEDRMTLLMEKKVRLAESVRDKTCGHFQWIFTSHENPGRNQSGEAFRELDRVGPVNYKGLLSPWGEPADVFYMYRSSYAPKETEPMAYIVSHTWPNRWTAPGIKDSISVYSNCDEVELFNGLKTNSLGRKQNRGKGTHFQWDNVRIDQNLLYAVGYVDGREVASDYIVLHHLPESPGVRKLKAGKAITRPGDDRNYLYRVNCGGPEYKDSHGNTWMADVNKTPGTTWGSTSWTDDFPDMPPFFGSQRRTFDPIPNTADWELFQTFRYGRHKLKYHFPVPDGEYLVELFFIEPWYGTGGGMDCTDWRNFDVAVNGRTVLDDLDIWKEAGHDKALKRSVKVNVTGGALEVSFPEVRSGQAVISAIAVSTSDHTITPAPPSGRLIKDLEGIAGNGAAETWCDLGHRQYTDDDIRFSYLPPELYGAEWIRTANSEPGREPMRFTVSEEADVYVALDARAGEKPAWLEGFADIKTTLTSHDTQKHTYNLFRKRFAKGSEVALPCDVTADHDKYTVFVTPATRIEPPFDLKPKTSYNSDVAVVKGDHVLREIKYGRDCATFLETAGDTLEWKIYPGVADYYAFHIKFSNETGGERTAIFNLLAADGTLMKTDLIHFRQTPETKYREVTTSTDSMINAGDYTVQIISKDSKGLSIRGITVQ